MGPRSRGLSQKTGKRKGKSGKRLGKRTVKHGRKYTKGGIFGFSKAEKRQKLVGEVKSKADAVEALKYASIPAKEPDDYDNLLHEKLNMGDSDQERFVNISRWLKNQGLIDYKQDNNTYGGAEFEDNVAYHKATLTPLGKSLINDV